MPKLIDRVQEQRFTGLFVGNSKVGKSVAAVSFPKPLDVDDFDLRIGGAQVPWLDLAGVTYDAWPPKSEGLITKLNTKLENLLASSRLMSAQTMVSVPKTSVCDSITQMNYAFICQAIPLTHQKKNDSGKEFKSGKWIGPIAMPGPEDYGLEAQGSYDYVAFMKSLPIQNFIMSAHYVDVFGKEDPDNPYSANVVVGKKLSIRDKIGTNIQSNFDHIFEFERVSDRFYVTFKGGSLAWSSYDWLPMGKHEWTKKNFYEFMMSFKTKQEAGK